MQQKYIKFWGTSGTGKSTMVKELAKKLTGNKITTWNNEKCPPIVDFSICDCHKYSAIGRWTEGKREGMDTISNQGEDEKTGKIGEYATKQKGTFVPHKKDWMTFNYAEKIAEGQLSCINSEVIFEEGLMTASKHIQGELNKKYEYYVFLMDLPLEKCLENYKNRGSEVIEDVTIPKMEAKRIDAIKYFDKLQVQNKFKLSGTIEENVIKIIEIAKLTPCNCMKNKIISEKIPEVKPVPIVKDKIRNKSLFD
jgi:predicted kinase